jgi:hypothetical protein
MSGRVQAERILSKPAGDDEHVVLRLAREALRQDPPRVQFVGRSGRAAQGALPWLACD